MAIEMTMAKMKKVVAWSVVTHDGDLAGAQRGDFLERIIPECEPFPVSIDTWARGTGGWRRVNEIYHIRLKDLRLGLKLYAARIKGCDIKVNVSYHN
jgi:hypothetical protein